MSVEAPLQFVGPREPKPAWLKVRAPGSENYIRLKGIMHDLKLNTVCEDAHCPNIGECWHHGTATFMILGDVCTRACAYCAVAHGKPNELDTAEPARVAEAVARMGLQYAVVTSVDRDDLADGGAFIFAETIRLTRERVPGCRIEGPDSRFPGHRVVAADGPRRRAGRAQSQHRDRSPPLSHGAIGRPLSAGRSNCSTGRGVIAPTSPPRPASWSAWARSTTRSSRSSTICDTPACRFSPSVSTCARQPKHARMVRYYHPDEFAALKQAALDRGFVHVESGPLVRSSYHAHEQADAFQKVESSQRSKCVSTTLTFDL